MAGPSSDANCDSDSDTERNPPRSEDDESEVEMEDQDEGETEAERLQKAGVPVPRKLRTFNTGLIKGYGGPAWNASHGIRELIHNLWDGCAEVRLENVIQ